jgi:CubicO group peptidase (beta-lactamase class C family)
MKKRILIASGLALTGCLIWGGFYLNSLMPVITGYPAKYLCSAVFISNRKPADVVALDLNFSLIRYVTNEINFKEKSVTSRFLWSRSKAIYRYGFGSTLLRGADTANLATMKFPELKWATYSQDYISWPYGNIIPDNNTGIDRKALAEIAENLVKQGKYGGNPFAIVVVHKGVPVAEQYKAGMTKRSRFLGWSIAKSLTNALAGIMVKDSLLNITDKTGIPGWQNDSRKNITINDLMQMQSGLRWTEDYGSRSDVTKMLYTSSDFAGYAMNQPPEDPAGSKWYYSSGSTNIVSSLLRKKFSDDSSYHAYVHTRLLDKIGMPNAVLETDPTGTIAGSSYVYATARDYARFGLLYLRDGVFNGERILPEGWVRYTTTPASHSDGSYGAFFWLNKSREYPSAPADMYYCNGHDGQRVFIIPSADLVIAVMGYSPKPDHEIDFDRLLKDILGGLK